MKQIKILLVTNQRDQKIMDGHAQNGFEIILSIPFFNKMRTLFNLPNYNHKGADFGVGQKFSHGELILSKNAGVIQLKCPVGTL